MGEFAVGTKSVGILFSTLFRERNVAGNMSSATRLDVKWLDIGRKGGLVFKSLYVYVRRKEKAVLKDSSLHNNYSD